MTTNTKNILQCKVTLEDEDMESWQTVSAEFKGANTASIIRMAIHKLAEEVETRRRLAQNMMATKEPNPDELLLNASYSLGINSKNPEENLFADADPTKLQPLKFE